MTTDPTGIITPATALDASPPPGEAAKDAASSRRPRDRTKSWTYGTLVAGALLMMIPFVWMVSTSLKSQSEAAKGPEVLWPDELRFSNYPEALARMDFSNALANTVVITSLSVLGQVVSSSLVGFGFARFRFRGREALFLVMLSTMMLPPHVTMIPIFILFRSIGWVDTFLPLIIPMWVGTPFYIFMFRQFFSQVPEELLEAARIDGASAWMIYWRLMLPLSKPVIAIVAIYTFMFSWNDFLGPLIYLNDPENRTLALALNAFSGQYGVRFGNLLMAATCVTLLPCVILFFSAQRYFVQGEANAGLKG